MIKKDLIKKIDVMIDYWNNAKKWTYSSNDERYLITRFTTQLKEYQEDIMKLEDERIVEGDLVTYKGSIEDREVECVIGSKAKVWGIPKLVDLKDLRKSKGTRLTSKEIWK